MENLESKKPVETSLNNHQLGQLSSQKPQKRKVKTVVVIKREILTTKKAVELLLNGTLKSQVCRYCLNITYPLSELDQYMQIGGNGALYKVTIRDIVASVHPLKVADDPNYPNKICEKCLNEAIRAYLFSQQCDQAERALRNCLEDMYEKLDKLDPLEVRKKRGRQKLHPNHNVLYAEHKNVMDYAEPIRNLISTKTVSLTNEPQMSELECKRCWQVLPNVESLVNHETIHPKSMWYHCRMCGRSFAKRHLMTRHLRYHAKGSYHNEEKVVKTNFECRQCGHASDNYNVHLQHIEKHKFKMVLEHLVACKMDKLCAVCFDNKGPMVDMEKMICLHGGYLELTGDRSLYNILGSTVPEMNVPLHHTGKNICEKCLDYAITSYIFINKTHYIRDRLNACVTNMIEGVNGVVNPENKIFIEVALNSIMPVEEEFDENLLLDEHEVDEEKLKIDVLEDEFRIKSESEESSDENATKDKTKVSNANSVKKVQTKKKLVNGFLTDNSGNLGEFLSFKNKGNATKKGKCRYTCPVCSKQFITDYFLKRHVIKHVSKNVQCKMCKNNFKSRFHLHEHVKMAHLLKEKQCFSCRICGRAFGTIKKLLLHKKCHTARECELCSKVFLTQKHYNSHLQRHGTKLAILRLKPIQTCSFCEKEFSNDNQLSIHVNRTHLQIKPYSCDMCDKQYYSETDLLNHKKIHYMRSKEKCEFCSKSLKSRRALVVHLRKHIGIKPYQCSLCVQKFYSEFKVKQHMKTWHGGSYSCKLCKKVFMNKKGLKDHENSSHSFF